MYQAVVASAVAMKLGSIWIHLDPGAWSGNCTGPNSLRGRALQAVYARGWMSSHVHHVL